MKYYTDDGMYSLFDAAWDAAFERGENPLEDCEIGEDEDEEEESE